MKGEKELKYLKFSDEKVIEETKLRLSEIKKLLKEIRDILKSAA